MPIMDGVTMLGELGKNPALKDIPVIMLTAESGREYIASVAAFGVKGYLAKPFKDEQLIEKIRSLRQLDPKLEAVAA
jgi:two-component system cell cycle response regulator